jgi:hypothetical protein
MATRTIAVNANNIVFIQKGKILLAGSKMSQSASTDVTTGSPMSMNFQMIWVPSSPSAHGTYDLEVYNSSGAVVDEASGLIEVGTNAMFLDVTLQVASPIGGYGADEGDITNPALPEGHNGARLWYNVGPSGFGPGSKIVMKSHGALQQPRMSCLIDDGIGFQKLVFGYQIDGNGVFGLEIPFSVVDAA